MTQDARAFNWDSIPVKTGATADPAVGAQGSVITVGTGKRMKIQSLWMQIVCDATVANRIFRLKITDGTNVLYDSPNGVTATATQTVPQSFMKMSLLTTAGTQYGMHFPDLELAVGYTAQVYIVSGLQAGDNVTATTYSYQEAPA